MSQTFRNRNRCELTLLTDPLSLTKSFRKNSSKVNSSDKALVSRSAGLYGHRGPGVGLSVWAVPCTALLGEQAQQLLHFAHERRKALPRLATIGARFHHVAKGFYGPDSLPSMGKKTAGGSGRSARACLLEVSNLAAIKAAAG